MMAMPTSMWCVKEEVEPRMARMTRIQGDKSWMMQSLWNWPAPVDEDVGNDKSRGAEGPLTPALSPSDGERVAAGRVRGWLMGLANSLSDPILPSLDLLSLTLSS